MAAMLKYFIGTVTKAYTNRVIRLYIFVRFRIINRSILDVMLNYQRPDKDMLVLGCGFGLFDLLIGMKFPMKRIRGYDLSQKRLQQATAARDRIGLKWNEFVVKDLRDDDLALPACDEILVLDIIHHLPPHAQARLIEQAYGALRPGGYLIIKDIDANKRFGLFFTWLLDFAMTRGDVMWYRQKKEMHAMLQETGFYTFSIHLHDPLPYPHILYVAIKEQR
jgi:2-polyprenyl-3-methyl-5-hydroxy-6-metoxy-1,4-benzoquinol methylase